MQKCNFSLQFHKTLLRSTSNQPDPLRDSSAPATGCDACSRAFEGLYPHYLIRKHRDETAKNLVFLISSLPRMLSIYQDRAL